VEGAQKGRGKEAHESLKTAGMEGVTLQENFGRDWEKKKKDKALRRERGAGRSEGKKGTFTKNNKTEGWGEEQKDV